MKLLDRYIEATTLKAFLLVAFALTALFSLLEFVEQLHDVGQARYGITNAFDYVLLTAPSRVLQLTPVSALLGSLLGLGSLASSSELTAMRAAGVSERRIIGWVSKLGVVIMIALFLVAEFVIPPAQRLAQVEREYKIAPTEALRTENGFWARGDHRFLNVRRFADSIIPEDLDIYVFAPDGTLQSFIHAGRAEVQSNGIWLLTDVIEKQFDPSHVETSYLGELSWTSFLRPQQVQLLTLPPESMGPFDLYQYVHDLKQQHEDAARYEQQLWTLASIPLATLAMVFVAIPFVFGSFRAQSPGQRITIGAMIGITFSLTQQIAGYVSSLLSLNPAFAAILPSVLLLLLSFYLARLKTR